MKCIEDDFAFQVFVADSFQDDRSVALSQVFSSIPELAEAGGRFSQRNYPHQALVYREKAPLISEMPATTWRTVCSLPIGRGRSCLGVFSYYSKRKPSECAQLLTSLQAAVLGLSSVLRQFFVSFGESLLAPIRRALLKSHPHARKMQDVVELIRNLIPSDGCTMFLLDSDLQVLVLEATTGLYGTGRVERPRYRVGEGLTGWVAYYKRSLRIYNIDDPEELALIADDLAWANKYSEINQAELADFSDWRSFLAVPIRHSHTVKNFFGVIRLSRRKGGESYLPYEQHALERVAHELSSYFVERASADYRSDLHYLRDLEQRLVSPAFEPEAVLRGILGRMSDIALSEDGYISLLDPTSGTFSEVVSVGERLESRARVKVLGVGHAGKALRDQRTVCVNNAKERAHFRDPSCSPISGRPEVLSEVAIPFLVHGRSVGVVNLHSTEEYAFDHYTLGRLENLAAAAAVVIDYALKLSSKAAQLELVSKLLSGVGSYTDLPWMYSAVLQSLVSLTYASAGALLLAHEGKLVVEALCDYNGLVEGLEVGGEEGVAGACYTFGERKVWVKGSKANDCEPLVIDPEVVYEVGIPIIDRGESLGCLVLAFSEMPEVPLTDEVFSIMTLLASQVGMATTASRMLSEREMIEEKRNSLEKQVTIGMVVAEIVHDLSNRLEGIRGILEELGKKSRGTKIAVEMSGRVDLALTRVSELNRMVARLKVIGRAGPGEVARCYINEVVESATGILRPFASSRAVRVELNLAKELDRPKRGDGYFLMGDFLSLDRAVENIIRNAIEHSFRRKPVRVTTRLIRARSSKDFDLIRLTVEDYGRGIRREHFSRIFDPGFTTRESGTGFGLPSARSIVEAAGGRITFDSQVGKGTVFTITFAL
ncbi:MAG: GAF domain-containing protein [Acidobacteriota bacterium]|nr:GAF domain-containing protein [Acidobacteriota bacterium]